jgi:predicted RNA-binding protein YlqC (UPF0109 family)
MKELVTAIVKNLVDDESSVSVKEVLGEDTDLIEVTAAKEDVGKLIGKSGRTANAIRHILKASGKKHNKKYHITFS